jgi:serine/threonine-protein kinase
MFGLFGAVIGVVTLIFRQLTIAITGPAELMFHRALAFHAFGFGCLAVAWLLLRGRPRSRRFISTVEYASLLGCCLGVVGLGTTVPIDVAPELLMPFSMGLIVIIRAVFVPSTKRRTLLIALLLGPLVVGATYVTYSRNTPPMIELEITDRQTAIALRTAMSAISWLLITMVSAATSKVIYGLRQEIRDIRKLGQYTLERKLGEGGMGAVYQASHAMLRRPAAVKLLPPRKVGDGSIARFEREVQLTARLTHANTVTVFDYGRTPDGVFYYVMELIDGINLLSVAAIDGPQPPGRVVAILSQAAGALSEAHAIGLIHRDIKPANIMLCQRGGEPDVVKVVDFGLVKQIKDDVASSLTNADVIQGTPQYMSPEAIRSPDEVGPSSDLYALGAVGYFLLTGEHLFTGNAVEVCGHHLHTAPTPPSERLGRPLPRNLEELILRCLAKDPADRPASAEALQTALRHADPRDWSPEDAKRWWRAHSADIHDHNGGDQQTGHATVAVDLAARGHAPVS